MATTTSATALPSLGRSVGKAHLGKSQGTVVTTTHFGNLRALAVPTIPPSIRAVPADRKRHLVVVSKAVGERQDSSSGSIVKSIRDAWNKSDDRIAIFGLGFAGIVAFWASVNLIGAIDKLPVIPGVLEFVGIAYSWWFIYRFLLFKPDREELVVIVKKSISVVVGK